MKEILIKYGILANILSASQLDGFALYAEQAKSRNFKSFYDFLDGFNKNAVSRKKEFDILYSSTENIIKRAIELSEAVIPDQNISLLSAFGRPNDDEFFTLGHRNMILALSALDDEVNVKLTLCEKIISNASDEALTELTLRYIALSELSPETELLKLYKSIYENRESYSRIAHIKCAEEYSTLIKLIDNALKSLCADSDKAHESIKSKNATYALYDRIIRQYTANFHDLYLKLRELQGGNNVKI